MIASRQIAFGKAAGAKGLSAKDYIQDGLVAMWDGIENAGWGKHDARKSTSKNLVGNSIFSDITWSGNFSILNKGIRLNSNAYNHQPDNGIGIATLNGTLSGMRTIEVVVSNYTPNHNISNPREYFTSFIVSNNTYPCLYITSTNMATHGLPNLGLYTSSWDNTIIDNSHFFLPIDDPEISTYGIIGGTGVLSDNYALYNGLKRMCSNRVNMIPYLTSSGNLELFNRSSDYLRGANLISYSTRLYNRALTAEEVAHNYEIDRVRFN